MVSVVERFIEDIQDVLPNVVVSMDPPADSGGAWFVDFRFNQRDVVVLWHATERYFGVSLNTGDIGYGEKPNWVSRNYYKTLARVLRLLAFGV